MSPHAVKKTPPPGGRGWRLLISLALLGYMLFQTWRAEMWKKAALEDLRTQCLDREETWVPTFGDEPARFDL